MMRTYISRYKKSSANSLPRSQETLKPQLMTNTLPVAQTKSNEEGLAEWEAQRQKWARMGTPWMDKVPNLKGELAQPWIQGKLTIGEPGDKYEQEADRVAAKVVQQLHAPTSSESVHDVDSNEVVWRQSNIQRFGLMEGGAASPEVETSIQQARSGGQPLDASIRQPMEQAFGADFSGVRVHTDAQADGLNRSLLSRAFTTKQDLFFKRGEYQPNCRGGQELLAHELTHVVQQNGSAVQRAPQSGLQHSHSIPKLNNVIQRTVVVLEHSTAEDPITEDPSTIGALSELTESEKSIFEQWQSEPDNEHKFSKFSLLIKMLKKTAVHEEYMETRQLSEEEKNGQGIYVHAHAKKSFKIGGDRFYEGTSGDQVCDIDLSVYPHIELDQLLLYSSLVHENDNIDEGVIAPIAYVPKRRGKLWLDATQSDLFIHVSHGGRLLTMGGVKDIKAATAGKRIMKKGNPWMKETNPQHVSSHAVHPLPGLVAGFHAHWAYTSEGDLKSDLALLIDNFEAIGTNNSAEIYSSVKYGLGVGYERRRKEPGGEAAFNTANAMRQLFGLPTHIAPMLVVPQSKKPDKVKVIE